MPKRVPQTFCPSSLRHASNIFIRQVCGAPRTFLFRKFHVNFKAIGRLEWCRYWCGVNNLSLIGLIRITPWQHQSALKPFLRLVFSLPLQCKLRASNLTGKKFEAHALAETISLNNLFQSDFSCIALNYY